jgi:hypothetical protein
MPVDLVRTKTSEKETVIVGGPQWKRTFLSLKYAPVPANIRARIVANCGGGL